MSEWMKFNWEPLSELEIPVALLGARGDGNPYETEYIHGFFYEIYCRNGSKSGFFRRKRKWYSVDIVPNQPMKLTQLKGAHVMIRHNDGGLHSGSIKVNRTHNAENITIL